MKTTTIGRLIAGALGLSIHVAAVSAAPATGPGAEIKRAIESKFPEVKIEQVNPVPRMPGLYEVVTPTEIIYANAKGDTLVIGKLVETQTKKDITAERWSELHKVGFASLPLDLAIKTVKGNGSRQIAVFSDPDCPFCKKLEQELGKVDNITVYTFLLPLEELHPNARTTAKKIWCSKDRSAAWSAWMLKQTMPAADACADEPTGKIIALGEKLKISATPTIILSDGHRVDGMLPGAQLEQRLAAIKPPKG